MAYQNYKQKLISFLNYYNFQNKDTGVYVKEYRKCPKKIYVSFKTSTVFLKYGKLSKSYRLNLRSVKQVETVLKSWMLLHKFNCK